MFEKSLKGTVKKREVEGGVWVLETEDKKIYQLKDGPADLYQDGVKVTLEGKVRKDLMGFGMSGPIFEVKKVR